MLCVRKGNRRGKPAIKLSASHQPLVTSRQRPTVVRGKLILIPKLILELSSPIYIAAGSHTSVRSGATWPCCHTVPGLFVVLPPFSPLPVQLRPVAHFTAHSIKYAYTISL
jgi:hypothetical protein